MIGITIDRMNYKIERPYTWEAALVQLQNDIIFSMMTPKLLFEIRQRVDMINQMFNVDLNFKTIENDRIIIFRENGEEIIIPEPLSREVRIEKFKLRK